MNVSVVIVGINQWEEYTLPLVRSIQRHEPLVNIVVVDNASDEAYPSKSWNFEQPIPNVLRLHERVCYSGAINAGVTDADWTIVINNDTICRGPFVESLEWMNAHTLYGNQLITYKSFRWLGLWLFVISKHVWEMVGEFDERFEVCGFDDADYCIRAQQLGISIEKCELPFHHFWGKTRWGVPHYPEIRSKNKERLEEKHSIDIGGRGDWKVFD